MFFFCVYVYIEKHTQVFMHACIQTAVQPYIESQEKVRSGPATSAATWPTASRAASLGSRPPDGNSEDAAGKNRITWYWSGARSSALAPPDWVRAA